MNPPTQELSSAENAQLFELMKQAVFRKWLSVVKFNSAMEIAYAKPAKGENPYEFQRDVAQQQGVLEFCTHTEELINAYTQAQLANASR